MGERFVLSVYNNSAHEVTFEVTNASCMHLPSDRKIKVPAYSWGEFGTFETSHDLLTGCTFPGNTGRRFNISASIGSRSVGNSTYKIFHPVFATSYPYVTISDYKNSIHWENIESGQIRRSKIIDSLVFERVDSYGDLFFNGRGYYFDDAIKSLMKCKPVGSESYKEIDDLPPTILINSNKQYIKDVDDSALANIIPRWINLGMSVYDVYKFTTDRDGAAKPRTSDLAATWKQFKDQIQGYFDLYKSAIANNSEATVHFFEEGCRPFFHIIFTDSLNNANDIMAGNFHLPPPKTDDNNFHRNILHISKEAHQAVTQKGDYSAATRLAG